MSRVLLIVIAGVLLLVVVGTVLLGAFPPEPQTEPVQRVLPNDRFQPR